MPCAAAKRGFDLLLASLGLLVLLPLGLVIAMLIKLADGGPIFFGQARVGQFGKPFRIWKFRSMIVNADRLGTQVTADGDRRITPVGRWLRKTKLDELPQLWNVLVGEMSFVGPRPEVPRYVERYTPEQRVILDYKPGITDVASMLFRNEEALLRGCAEVEDFYVRYCLPRKIQLNRQHAERASLARDLWVILQTLAALVPVSPAGRQPVTPAVRPGASRVAIVGAGAPARERARQLTAQPSACRQIVAFFDDDPWTWNRTIQGVPVAGMPECLLQDQWQHQIDEVIIALPPAEQERGREIEALLSGTPLALPSAAGSPKLELLRT